MLDLAREAVMKDTYTRTAASAQVILEPFCMPTVGWLELVAGWTDLLGAWQPPLQHLLFYTSCQPCPDAVFAASAPSGCSPVWCAADCLRGRAAHGWRRVHLWRRRLRERGVAAGATVLTVPAEHQAVITCNAQALTALNVHAGTVPVGQQKPKNGRHL